MSVAATSAAAKRRAYRNVPMDRATAEAIVIDAGLAIGNMPIRLRAGGDGFDVVMPAEALVALAKGLDR